MNVTASTPVERARSGMSVAVLVVDDQVAVREGLTRLVACAPLDLRAIASAATPAEALLVAAHLRPEVVLLDIDLAGADGLALIPLFGPAVGVLVLSCHGDPATRARARRLGALAFVEKHQPAAELLRELVAIVTLQTGGDKAPAMAGGITPRLAAASSDAAQSPSP